MNKWVWSIGAMILTGKNWRTGRKTLYSVAGRWVNEYGALVEWYRQGKTEVLGQKHYTMLVADEWTRMRISGQCCKPPACRKTSKVLVLLPLPSLGVLIMVAAWFTELLVPDNQTTRRHVSQDTNIEAKGSDNFISHRFHVHQLYNSVSPSGHYMYHQLSCIPGHALAG
jgi:hypothetical protein